MRAFADALDATPLALAENSGLSPIETLAEVKAQQATTGNPRLGIDCLHRDSNGECLQHQMRACYLILTCLLHSRYERTACIRPIDFQAPAIPSSHSARQDDLKDRRCYYHKCRWSLKVPIVKRTLVRVFFLHVPCCLLHTFHISSPCESKFMERFHAGYGRSIVRRS